MFIVDSRVWCGVSEDCAAAAESRAAVAILTCRVQCAADDYINQWWLVCSGR